MRRLESTIDSLEKAVAELIECYRDREDSAGVSNAEAGGGDLVKLRVQIRDFDAAADSEAATAAIDALTSGYLHLDEHFGTFTACEPAKKKKKRGRGD